MFGTAMFGEEMFGVDQIGITSQAGILGFGMEYSVIIEACHDRPPGWFASGSGSAW
jgi:hypothetical protein